MKVQTFKEWRKKNSASDGWVSAEAAWNASADRFIALADEVKKRKDVYALNPDYHHALEWAEERLRAIAEGRE